MTETDRVTAALDEIRKRYTVWGESDGLPALLAALDGVMKLVNEWSTLVPSRSVTEEDRMITRQICADKLREAISAGLRGEGGTR
jgi:hypothetical protein